MTTDLAKLVQSIVQTIWPLAIDLWEAWGIQLLVILSCFFQINLVTLGGRRRYSFNIYSRFIIWAFYLLASYVATFTLGKLTVVDIRDPENPDYNVGLKGILAPLLLVHLANPDCISAYSVEDNRLGIRQVLSLFVTVASVVWILIRCWDNSSPVRWLYFPLLTAGVIKAVITVYALKSVYDESTSADEIKRQYDVSTSPAASGFLKLILMAYKRFDTMRPHQVNWLYHPKYIENSWLSVDDLKPEDAFTVTEIELGFVFDVLYTKTPILYRKIGIVSRAISFSCLVSTLFGLSIIFRSAFLLDLYVTYTYALLMISTIMELYQICILPFSYWMIVKIWESKGVNKVPPWLVEICEKRRRWADSLHQFNMVEYCCKGDWLLLHLDERIKRYWRCTHKRICLDIKALVVEKMKSIPLSATRGLWTIDSFRNCDNWETMDSLKPTLRKDFDKSIIIWHIATDILLQSANPRSPGNKCADVSELLSNYMMYLLAQRPYMLSLTTSDITFGYASSIIKDFAHRQPSSREETLYKIETLSKNYNEEERGDPRTSITRGWRVLHDVKKVVDQLKHPEIKWELIASVWVEMLCFAADHCLVYHHARMLRKGGELITHVWLLRAHKTDKFPSEDSEPEVP